MDARLMRGKKLKYAQQPLISRHWHIGCKRISTASSIGCVTV
jgi:hypothetical protein